MAYSARALSARLHHGVCAAAAGGQRGLERGGPPVPGAASGRVTWQWCARQFGEGPVERKAAFWEEKLFKKLRI